MQQDVGIAERPEVGKQGRDESINSSVYNLSTYIFLLYMYYGEDICRVLYTKPFYAFIPTLLLSFCYPYIFNVLYYLITYITYSVHLPFVHSSKSPQAYRQQPRATT